jgi:hypothetical protein
MLIRQQRPFRREVGSLIGQQRPFRRQVGSLIRQQRPFRREVGSLIRQQRPFRREGLPGVLAAREAQTCRPPLRSARQSRVSSHRQFISASAAKAGVPEAVGLPELFTWLVQVLGVNGFCDGVPHMGSCAVIQLGAAATQVMMASQLPEQ